MGYKMGKVFNKKNLVNLLYVLTIALSVGYFVNKQYNALVCLCLVAGGIYLFNKNVMYALGISIVVTNLLLSMNYLNVREGLDENKDDNKKSTQKLKDLIENIASPSDEGMVGQRLTQEQRRDALEKEITTGGGQTDGKRRSGR